MIKISQENKMATLERSTVISDSELSSGAIDVEINDVDTDDEESSIDSLALPTTNYSFRVDPKSIYDSGTTDMDKKEFPKKNSEHDSSPKLNNSTDKWVPLHRPLDYRLQNVHVGIDEEYLVVDVTDKGELCTSQTNLNDIMKKDNRNISFYQEGIDASQNASLVYPTMIPCKDVVKYDVKASNLYFDLEALESDKLIDPSSFINSDQALILDQSQVQNTVDLVPLLQSRIGLGYVNNLLLGEATTLAMLEKQTIESHHKFYIMCYEYYRSFSVLNKLKQYLKDALAESNTLQASLFEVTTHTFSSPSTTCGDGYKLEGQVTAVSAKLDTKNLELLGLKFAYTRKLFHEQIAEAKLINRYYWQKISHYIDDILKNELIFSIFTDSSLMQFRDASTRSDQDNSAVTHIRTCIQILLFFEQATHGMTEIIIPTESSICTLDANSEEMSSFRSDVRKWTRICVSHLLRVATVEDARFLIFELVRCRNIGEWGADFLQIPLIDSDQSVDEFLACFSVLLTPTFQKDMLLILNEEDYLSLWPQVPLFDSMEYVLSQSKQLVSNQSVSKFFTMESTFSYIDTVLYMLFQALNNFNTPSHGSFIRILSQNMVRLVQMASNSVAQLDGTNSEDVEFFFNSFYMKCFKGVLSSSSNLWSFLTELPYEIISEPCAVSIFWLMFNDVESVDSLLSLDTFKDLDAWCHKMTQDKCLRNNFIKIFERKECSYLLPVLSKLACTHSLQLASIIIHELFLIGCKYTCNQILT